VAESYIQLPADSTGNKLRTETQDIGGNTVHQEGMLIGNPDTADVATVLPASTATAATDIPLVVALHPEFHFGELNRQKRCNRPSRVLVFVWSGAQDKSRLFVKQPV